MVGWLYEIEKRFEGRSEKMGFYLKPVDVLELYGKENRKPYFVDKTKMLNEFLFWSRVETIFA